MEHVEVNGTRIAYERVGEGPPVVLVHGFVGDHRTWRYQLDGLSDTFTMIAWDGPGSGRSLDPPESYRMPEFADALAEFIMSIGAERPHVVGLSFGGALALELFRRHPTIPRTLVLASAYAGWAGSLAPEEVQRRLALSLELSDLPPGGLVSALLPTMFGTAAPYEPTAEFARAMSELHPAGFRAMAQACAEADLRDVLPLIDVPTLLLSGDEDVRAPRHVAEHLHARIPNAKLVVLPGVGHVSCLEAPERFNAEVRRFLQEAGS
jgi:pimeloyl-ACP methyl ester carboxylesterase